MRNAMPVRRTSNAAIFKVTFIMVTSPSATGFCGWSLAPVVGLVNRSAARLPADHVREILVVFLADVFQQFGPGHPGDGVTRGPRRGIRVRIVDRDLVVQRGFVGSREPLDD